MAFLRMTLVRTSLESKVCCALTFKRYTHGTSQSSPLDSAISQSAASPPLLLPEMDRSVDIIDYGFGSDFHIGTGSMELMAVTKKKTSPHKRGIRNGPKALKPRDVHGSVAELNYLIFSAAMGLGTLMDPMVQPVDPLLLRTGSPNHHRCRTRCDPRFISFLFICISLIASMLAQ